MFLLRFLLGPLSIMIPMMVVGLKFMWDARRLDRKSQQLGQWSETTGRILDSAMIERRTKGRIIYEVKATYEYSVSGRKYQSRQISLGDRWLVKYSKGDAEAEHHKYLQGREVKVYYDPNYPVDAILDLTMQSSPKWMLVFGHVFFWAGLLIGSAILISSLRDCGFTLQSLEPAPDAPAWCRR
jgi:hypothetical protein